MAKTRRVKVVALCWGEGVPCTYGQLAYEDSYRLESGGEVYTKLHPESDPSADERARQDATRVIPIYPV